MVQQRVCYIFGTAPGTEPHIVTQPVTVLRWNPQSRQVRVRYDANSWVSLLEQDIPINAVFRTSEEINRFHQDSPVPSFN